MQTINDVALDLGIVSLSIMTLWLYLPGFLANTFAMMWGNGYLKPVMDHGQSTGAGIGKMAIVFLVMEKLGTSLIGGSVTSGLLCVIIVGAMGEVPMRILIRIERFCTSIDRI